ncbi:hypothetical protein BKA70DRAFT_1218601 [Coprinopsis sp. MPI-PUGE-AT-0042]|nr:hypothetical protein BKA70DRAFT_1218601 [Coprinopsis sp. MPI-PUGE-AT-0042]
MPRWFRNAARFPKTKSEVVRCRIVFGNNVNNNYKSNEQRTQATRDLPSRDQALGGGQSAELPKEREAVLPLSKITVGVCSHETGSWVSARRGSATTTTQQAEARTIQISIAINIPNQNEEANKSRQADSRRETAKVGCGLSKGRERVVSLSNERKASAGEECMPVVKVHQGAWKMRLLFYTQGGGDGVHPSERDRDGATRMDVEGKLKSTGVEWRAVEAGGMMKTWQATKKKDRSKKAPLRQGVYALTDSPTAARRYCTSTSAEGLATVSRRESIDQNKSATTGRPEFKETMVGETYSTAAKDGGRSVVRLENAPLRPVVPIARPVEEGGDGGRGERMDA